MAPHSLVVYSVCKDKEIPLYMRAMMRYNYTTDEIFNKLLHLVGLFCAFYAGLVHRRRHTSLYQVPQG